MKEKGPPVVMPAKAGIQEVGCRIDGGGLDSPAEPENEGSTDPFPILPHGVFLKGAADRMC